jgi:uncharacterized CHY-type Zn-finger protein
MRPEVKGVGLDDETRCAHYHSALDIIAIKMACCGVYYACRECHDELAGHEVSLWPAARWGDAAILCGACGTEITILDYLSGDNRCLSCHAPFNPGCKTHHHLYFGPPPTG